MAKKRRQSRLSISNQHNRHELDIVIPVYGRPDLLRECLQSLQIAAFDVDYQLFVVDDASPNKAAMEIVYNSLNSDTKILQNNENRGFPATANRGANLGKSPSILFLNTDVMLQAGSVRAMLNTLWGDQSPKGPITPAADALTGVVAPKLLFPDTAEIPPDFRGKVQHAGLAINAHGRPFHIQKGWSSDNPRLDHPRAMQAVSGACLMTRRDVWQTAARDYQKAGDPSTGGFNEIYGLGTYEDVEYCFVARANGHKVVYESAAVGYHYAGASVTQRPEDGYPLERNKSIFMARCGHLLFWDEWLFW
jgi:GT2 family glycosyltransferase